MPQEITIFKPDLIPNDKYLVTWNNPDGGKIVEAVTASEIANLTLLKKSAFSDQKMEREAFVKWLLGSTAGSRA